MKIISIKNERENGVIRIGLSDGSLFSLRLCYLPEELQNIPINCDETEITIENEKAFRYASDCMRTEHSALNLISRAEQCISGLSGKLKQRGHERDCVNDVIDRLCKLSLIDDARFARLWLESKLRLTRSPNQLLASLCTRGISRKDAEKALSAVLDEEAEFLLLERYVKKYRRKKKKSEDVKRNRDLNYLLKNEGFSHQAIERFFEEDN